jgi:hypothetical protein
MSPTSNESSRTLSQISTKALGEPSLIIGEIEGYFGHSFTNKAASLGERIVGRKGGLRLPPDSDFNIDHNCSPKTLMKRLEIISYT